MCNSVSREHDVNEIEELIEDDNFQEIEDQVRKEKGRPNIFKIIDPKENRITKFYRWLLTPRENHGLGNKFLKNFLKLVYKNSKHKKFRGVSFQWNKVGEPDFSPSREKGEPDLVIEIPKEDGSFACIIENKYGAEEGEDQLKRYREIAEDNYDDNILVFLTEKERQIESDPGNEDRWVKLRHKDVISQSLEQIYPAVPDVKKEGKVLINHFKRELIGESISGFLDKIENLEENQRDALKTIIFSKPWKTVKLMVDSDRLDGWRVRDGKAFGVRVWKNGWKDEVNSLGHIFFHVNNNDNKVALKHPTRKGSKKELGRCAIEEGGGYYECLPERDKEKIRRAKVGDNGSLEMDLYNAINDLHNSNGDDNFKMEVWEALKDLYGFENKSHLKEELGKRVKKPSNERFHFRLKGIFEGKISFEDEWNKSDKYWIICQKECNSLWGVVRALSELWELSYDIDNLIEEHTDG